MSYKKIDPKLNSIKENYHLLISGVSPRPIALVGSKDKKNNYNLAPFSFFNAFGANPPIVGFSPALSGRTGLPKHTLLNIKSTKEFTVSVVTSELVHQTSLASCEFDENIDEFEKSGLNKNPSKVISIPGVKESPFIMECKLIDIIELGSKPGSGNLILGEVVFFHIDKGLFDNDGSINPFKIDQVGRNGGSWYTEVKKSLFSISKPRGLGIGFDAIPREFLNSALTGNQLAKLASVIQVPKSSNINIPNNFQDLLSDISKMLDKEQIEKAWEFILKWKQLNG
tara:strand:+ start:1108 stop:1956 length:849 start_codon:yes stop_codon:yes gene_type:complete